MESSQLFRKAALQRLSNPEQLDRVLFVTTFKGWLAVAALALIAAAVVAWSITGEVSTYVNAQGILLHRGGNIVDARASGGGTLTEIRFAVGDAVELDTVVALAVDREAAERHRSALDLVEERTRAVADLEAALGTEDAQFSSNFASQRKRLDELERNGRNVVASARERLESHEQLLRENVVTRVTVDRSQQAFDRAQRDLFATLQRIEEIKARELQRRNQREVRLSEERARLQAATRQANEIRTRLETQRILAPVAGIITEIKTTVGTVLRPGQPVVSLETGTAGLEALIYIPPADGKRVRPGMDVLVTPSTVRRQEHGSLKGAVRQVSAFPITVDGMVAVLQNRDLARATSENGSPFASRVELMPDPSTASGFAWTSPSASEETLTSGTLVDAEVKVESQPPITMVVPLIKETLGL